MWSEIVIFVGFFGGLFVARIIVATIVFFWILPEGDRCPICDAPTIRVTHGFWNRVTPWLRTSWCMECDWSGLLRPGPLTPMPTGSPPPDPPLLARPAGRNDRGGPPAA